MTKRVDIPDAEPSGRNLDERRYVSIGEYHVFEWTPERDGKGKAEQVHLVFDVPGTPISLTLAFKTADAVDRMIATLIRHRNGVWGGGAG